MAVVVLVESPFYLDPISANKDDDDRPSVQIARSQAIDTLVLRYDIGMHSVPDIIDLNSAKELRVTSASETVSLEV